MSLQIFHNITPLSSPSTSNFPSTQFLSRFVPATSHVSNCSNKSPSVGLSELQSQFKPPTDDLRPIETKPSSSSSSDDTPESEGISGIKVPRQRYIAASKSQLLGAITSTMFNSPEEADQFRHVSL